LLFVRAKLPRKARQLNCLPIAKTAKLKIKDFKAKLNSPLSARQSRI
jgi:hypothetical protein